MFVYYEFWEMHAQNNFGGWVKIVGIHIGIQTMVVNSC